MKCFWAFSTFSIGGPQRRFVSIVETLGPDFTHIVMAMDNCYDAEMLLRGGVDYTRCPLPAEKSAFISRANVRQFANALATAEPDLLLTSNWGTIEWRLANRKTRIPHVHFEDGFGPDEATGRRNWRRDMARRWLFSRHGTGHDRYAFVAPSNTLGVIFENNWRVAADRLNFIPNGVDIRRFVSVEPPGARNIPTIGAVGALRPEKRFDRLLHVFAGVRRKMTARLLIVGDGPLLADLRAMADDLGIAGDVAFAGAQSDVAPYLKLMDVYAITSDTEQMPISLIEAMAAGLPVVAPDVGDICAMLARENRCFTHRPDNEKGLASSALRLLHDHQLRASLGAANAAKAALEYSLDSMTDRYRALFASVAR